MAASKLPCASDLLSLYVEHQGSWKAMGAAMGRSAESIRGRFRALGLVKPVVVKTCPYCSAKFLDRSSSRNQITCGAHPCERARDRARFNAGEYARKPPIRRPKRCGWCRSTITVERQRQSPGTMYYCLNKCQRAAESLTNRCLPLMGPRSLYIMQELAYRTRGRKKPAKRYQPKEAS